MIVDVTIPGLRTVCELNSHEHWRKRQRRAREQHDIVGCILGPTAARRAIAQAPLVVTLTRIAPSRGLDEGDNLPSSQKHVRDAVAKVLGIDDRDPRVRWIYAQSRGPWSVQITIGIV